MLMFTVDRMISVHRDQEGYQYWPDCAQRIGVEWLWPRWLWSSPPRPMLSRPRWSSRLKCLQSERRGGRGVSLVSRASHRLSLMSCPVLHIHQTNVRPNIFNSQLQMLRLGFPVLNRPNWWSEWWKIGKPINCTFVFDLSYMSSSEKCQTPHFQLKS